MSFHMCMCVLKTQTLLPSLLNDIRINSNMRTSEMNQEKNENEFRMSFLFVHAKQNAIFVNEIFLKNASYNYFEQHF